MIQFGSIVHICFKLYNRTTLLIICCTIRSLQDAHPSWSYASERNSLLSTTGSVRRINNRSLDLSNEQDLHRIAAARQLEVLERIEEGRSSEPESNDDLLLLPNIIDDSYIPIISATKQ